VEAPREGAREHDTDHDERRDEGDVRPARPVEAPELPEHDLLTRLGVSHEGEERDPGSRDRVDRVTREDERDDLGAPARTGQQVYDEGRREPAREGDRGRGPRAEEGPPE